MFGSDFEMIKITLVMFFLVDNDMKKVIFIIPNHFQTRSHLLESYNFFFLMDKKFSLQ